MRYLHEKVGEESMIDGGGSEGRGEMLQASKLQPPCHDNVANISAVVQQRCYGRGIALRNLHGHSRGAANVVEGFCLTGVELPTVEEEADGGADAEAEEGEGNNGREHYLC
ncbi:hypothetical protein GYH30_044526 [Glycine max]|nr:hypothetical protein GYH30_044526 [Glycine max]